MLVLAHRGLHAAHPENTLAAFAAALAAGADGCETDVRVAGDGAAVLFHDATSARGHPVATLSRAGLSRDQGYDVPTLEEALHALPGAFWNLELKEPEALAAIVRVMALLAPERLLVISFIHDTAMACARDLGLPSALLVAQRPASVRDLLSPFAPWPQLRTVVHEAEAPANLVRVRPIAGRQRPARGRGRSGRAPRGTPREVERDPVQRDHPGGLSPADRGRDGPLRGEAPRFSPSGGFAPTAAGR